MKLATWNINGLVKRLDLVLRWLGEARPDVVALQETKTPDTTFPTEAVLRAGYRAVHVGERTWNGVALLARIDDAGSEPVPVRRALPGDEEDRQARYVEAAIGGVLVASIYLPNGNPQPGPKFVYKQAWFARLIDHAGSLIATGHPVALLGDFNVVPTDADMYRSTSRVPTYRDNALVQPEPRASWQALLAQGWTDAVRTLHPHETVYTFWDYLRQSWPRDAGLRIDHVLLSPSLADRLASAEVDRRVRGWDGTSNHAPVVIEVAGPRRRAGRRAP